MSAETIAVLGVGLLSGVGLTAEESCAAIRCGINKFSDTRFIGPDGEWLVGSSVELEDPCRGLPKLTKMVARAIAECTAAEHTATLDKIPVLLCIGEPERPGQAERQRQVKLIGVEEELGIKLHAHSRVIEQGRVGGAIALLNARRMLKERNYPGVIVAGVDSYLTGETLAAYGRQDRLLTRKNSNGFIPGEAASAVLLAAASNQLAAPLLLQGLGFGREPSPFGSGKPLRAQGLVQAIRIALGEADISLGDCQHRIADVNGEQHRFKEAALAITRLLRDRKVLFSLWHPVDSIGEVGAATLPAMLTILFQGARKGYLPGPTFLGHLSNDDEKRAAFVASATTPQSLELEIVAEEAFGLKRRAVS
jgi:3-oxoacyl-[acyl-carrier-protein] synthase-1